jgi:hypothetical protein
MSWDNCYGTKSSLVSFALMKEKFFLNRGVGAVYFVLQLITQSFQGGDSVVEIVVSGSHRDGGSQEKCYQRVVPR